MGKAMAKNKQSTFADLVADSEPATKQVQIGDHQVTIREMSGRERFELSERADAPRWDTMLWVAFIGLVDPKPESLEAMEELKTDWVIVISNEILSISGLDADADETAENESASVTDIGGS